MGRFRFGQIIDAYISDGTGRTKDRPALIISDDAENDEGRDLLVIAITSNIEEPRPDYHVIVHSSRRRDPITGLDNPCVTKCNWVREVRQDRVIGSRGRMPAELLKTIVDNFDAIQADPSFDDWT